MRVVVQQRARDQHSWLLAGQVHWSGSLDHQCAPFICARRRLLSRLWQADYLRTRRQLGRERSQVILLHYAYLHVGDAVDSLLNHWPLEQHGLLR
ncbi:hypothetical protein D3C80_1941230 [compost metagenome]